MSETAYKGWLKKKKKDELVDLVYKLHIELVELKYFESRREEE
jgi:hypothetical protein